MLVLALVASVANAVPAHAACTAKVVGGQFVISGCDVVIKNANLFVQNGTGSTASANGKGNVIIGYDETSGPGAHDRSGSHNLVLGTENGFASYGGIVAGSQNTISAPLASVLGGIQNQAKNEAACVQGGRGNVASGLFASVAGGQFNQARGGASVAAGGFANIADANFATAVGGQNNLAAGAAPNDQFPESYTTTVGGAFNQATGTAAAAVGGTHNSATGDFASVTGGETNTASGTSSSVSGGSSRSALGTDDWTAGAISQDE